VNITQALSPGYNLQTISLHHDQRSEHVVVNGIASSAAVLLLVMTGIAGLRRVEKRFRNNRERKRRNSGACCWFSRQLQRF